MRVFLLMHREKVRHMILLLIPLEMHSHERIVVPVTLHQGYFLTYTTSYISGGRGLVPR
jgi:hypothetical protein